jgi:acetyl-CoA C-acetyltransferase
METAVILEGGRTPIGRFLGSYAELPAVDLGVLAAKEAMRRSNVEPDAIEQTIIGHARQAGNGPNTGRQVSVRAGVPVEVSGYNVNIACGSGMKAVQLGAQQIALGDSEVSPAAWRTCRACRSFSSGCAPATGWATRRSSTRCTGMGCSTRCPD